MTLSEKEVYHEILGVDFSFDSVRFVLERHRVDP
jgi:hypothetical protein